MKKLITALALTVALTGSALPAIAAAQPTVKIKDLEWQVKQLANKNLKFAGVPTRVVRVKCLGHGGYTYVCRARFNDGTGYYWPTVTVRNGYLKLSGGFVL